MTVLSRGVRRHRPHAIALAAHALNNFLTVSGAVVNLLIPALRGHPDHQIRVWPAHEQLGAHRDHAALEEVDLSRLGVVCRVRDEGPGLSASEQERLFLPGVRLGPVGPGRT